jgi:hypothetical protein
MWAREEVLDQPDRDSFGVSIERATPKEAPSAVLSPRAVLTLQRSAGNSLIARAIGSRSGVSSAAPKPTQFGMRGIQRCPGRSCGGGCRCAEDDERSLELADLLRMRGGRGRGLQRQATDEWEIVADGAASEWSASSDEVASSYGSQWSAGPGADGSSVGAQWSEGMGAGGISTSDNEDSGVVSTIEDWIADRSISSGSSGSRRPPSSVPAGRPPRIAHQRLRMAGRAARLQRPIRPRSRRRRAH